ncbi:hypothetical protein C1708_32395 [Streptomyces sp. DH-12]|uniref:hypothetical protein n=1 Tax=Streptomyces sp. DH-12 TaxID=2072509 RepID=UPI000CCE000D|nr:hypothetical protein [Streptomyces sp. DH-12]PNV36405.1 hypothetical protein C1708_32395 [Streptomyces sp. DH-12]
MKRIARIGLPFAAALTSLTLAAPVGASGQASAADAAGTAAKPWINVGTYWFLWNCQRDGRDAVAMNARWTQWKCPRNLNNTKYVLYVR